MVKCSWFCLWLPLCPMCFWVHVYLSFPSFLFSSITYWILLLLEYVLGMVSSLNVLRHSTSLMPPFRVLWPKLEDLIALVSWLPVNSGWDVGPCWKRTRRGLSPRLVPFGGPKFHWMQKEVPLFESGLLVALDQPPPLGLSEGQGTREWRGKRKKKAKEAWGTTILPED